MSNDPFDFSAVKRSTKKTRRTIITHPPKLRKRPRKVKPRLHIPPLSKFERSDDWMTGYPGPLHKASSPVKVQRWLRKNDNAFEKKAAKGIGRSKVPDDLRVIYDALLTKPGALSIPTISNRDVRADGSGQLARELIPLVQNDPGTEVAMVTFICGSGATSHLRPEIELALSQEKVQRTLRKMATNHFGITELTVFNSMKHSDGGRVIQRHEHALIWGRNILQRANAISIEHAALFKPNLTEARIIDVKEVARDDLNLTRMAAYLFKRSHQAKNWNPRSDDKRGHMNSSAKTDRAAYFLRLLQLQTMLTLKDVTFASGQGQDIRSAMLAHAKSIAETNARSSSVLIPAAIDRFWVDLLQAMKMKHWSVPVIIRKK
jgi:hypothetical protein